MEESVLDQDYEAQAVKDRQRRMRISDKTYAIRPARILGQGGFGVVIEGVHNHNSNWVPVAIKVTKQPYADQHEVQLTLHAAHPNVVRIYDSGVIEPGPGFSPVYKSYIVMELMEGSVNSYIAKHIGGPLHPELAASMFEDMVKAVKYLHSLNIYHRDIKPDNFLLDSNYRVKITDLGASKKFEDSNYVCKTLKGTPDFMEPGIYQTELGNAHNYNAVDADIYALGITLYHIAYDPKFRRLVGKMDKKNLKLGSEYISLPFSDQACPLLKELIVGMTRKHSKLQIEEILAYPWLVVNCKKQNPNEMTNSVLFQAAKAGSEDLVFEKINNHLRLIFVKSYLNNSQEALIGIIKRLLVYYSSEVKQLAEKSPLVSKLVQYSKIIAMSKVTMMRNWCSGSINNAQVQLDPISMVRLNNREVALSLADVIALVSLDPTLTDCKLQKLSSVDTSYRSKLEQVRELKEYDSDFENCALFFEATEGEIEDSTFPCYDVTVEINKGSFEQAVATLCGFSSPLTPHQVLQLNAYLMRTEYAIYTCAGLASCSETEIKAILDDKAKFFQPQLDQAFTIRQQQKAFVDQYAQN